VSRFSRTQVCSRNYGRLPARLFGVDIEAARTCGRAWQKAPSFPSPAWQKFNESPLRCREWINTSEQILLSRRQHPHPRGDDRERMTRARQAAEALFTPHRNGNSLSNWFSGLPTGQPIGVRTARAGNLIDGVDCSRSCPIVTSPTCPPYVICHIGSKIAMKIGACQHRAHRTEDSARVSALNILTGNALAPFSEHFHIAGSRRDSSQSEDDLIGRALHQHKLHFSEVYGLRRDQSGRIFLKNDRLVFHEGE
jgi:hypothetical protein